MLHMLHNNNISVARYMTTGYRTVIIVVSFVIISDDDRLFIVFYATSSTDVYFLKLCTFLSYIYAS